MRVNDDDDSVVRVAGHVFRFTCAPISRDPSCFRCELTTAEADVVALVCRGLSNAEIARARVTSQRTVANQLASIYRKLDVGARGELVALFARRASV